MVTTQSYETLVKHFLSVKVLENMQARSGAEHFVHEGKSKQYRKHVVARYLIKGAFLRVWIEDTAIGHNKVEI